MDDDEFKPGRGRKVAFWRTLAEAEGHPPPKTPEEYASLYIRWSLYGYYSDLAKQYERRLQQLGYRLVNKDKEHCVCGARIENRWLIVNHASKLYAYIGSECKEKFFLPRANSPRMALMQAIWLLSTLVGELKRVGIRTDRVEKLLGTTIYYIEKFTKYRNVYVSERFAYALEQYTGIKWRWKTWEKASKNNVKVRKEASVD